MLQTTRLTMAWLLVPVLSLFCLPISGSRSDTKGNDVVLGCGSKSCQTFLQARSNGLDLPYRHWLTGYLTAVNKLTKDTVDMRGTTDIDGMLGLLEHYCIKNRQHSFSRVVEALVKDLYPKRMTHMPQKPGLP
jgi:hypothetical protein